MCLTLPQFCRWKWEHLTRCRLYDQHNTSNILLPAEPLFCLPSELQDPTYKPLLGQLARIAFFSAAMHQLVFTIFSTLPFAVGQPQDVGLIFLSSMATGVAEIGRQQGLDDATVVGTALLTLTVATFVVGVMALLVGGCRCGRTCNYRGRMGSPWSLWEC